MDLHGWYEDGHLYMMRKGCWWWYTCIFTYIQYLYTFLKIKAKIEYHLEGYLQFYLKWKEKEKKKGRNIKISKKSKEKRKKEIEVFPFLKNIFQERFQWS